MPIHHDPEAGTFHLRNESLSYIVRVQPGGQVTLLHAGAPLDARDDHRHLFPREFRGFSNGGGDLVRLECPTPASGDYRAPGLAVEQADGSRVLDLRCVAHRVMRGKPALEGLPSTYVEDEGEAASLELELRDGTSGLTVFLLYTIFRDHAALARSLRVRNDGHDAARISCVMSAVLDLEDQRWDLVTLPGRWAAERRVERRALVQGQQGCGSLRGASSHHQNPFMALARPDAGEATGEAWGLSLVYSGNFLTEVEVDHLGVTRSRIGIHPEGFSWALPPGGEFQAPEAVLAYSGRGFEGLSDTYHGLYRTRLARGPWRDRPRPVLVNNWEGTYFDFTEERLLAIAGRSAELGAELFVLDDGWFGERDSDTSSLGDWTANLRKLPGGVEGLARKIEALGLKFGIWIEPEMVSEKSRLFEAHPDWAIGVPGRPRTEARNQLVLDFSRPEVVDHVHGLVAGLLSRAPISYVKWDMNRNITEPWSAGLPPERQGEFFHRYMLGLYSLYGRLTREFPGVLFESCAGGGGRFDPGILAYAPQAWASDDSDAIERLRIQWGSSLCYPLSSMGAHVSACPNHQVGRTTPLSTRAAVAFFGAFGYELDTMALGEEEAAEIKAQIALFKEWRETIQFGRFVRLRSPFEGDGNETAWACVSPDARRALVGFYRVLQRPAAGQTRLRLRGLREDLLYRVSTWPATGDCVDLDNAGLRRGDELSRVGLLIGMERFYGTKRGDFWSRLFLLEGEA